MVTSQPDPTFRVLNCAQARAIDQLAMERLGVPGLVLMENAGRATVDCMERIGINGHVLVCCGRGNNAGDGYVMARHLMVRGYRAVVLQCADPQNLTPDASTNLAIWSRLGGELIELDSENQTQQLSTLSNGVDWVVDALLGTGARGTPRPPLDEVIRLVNQLDVKRLAVDVPSGLGADSGEASEVTFCAHHTVTMVAAKKGLLLDSAKPFVGSLHVVDIGIPADLLDVLQ